MSISEKREIPPFKSTFIGYLRPGNTKFDFIVPNIESRINVLVKLPKEDVQKAYDEFGRDMLRDARKKYFPAFAKLKKTPREYWLTTEGKRVWKTAIYRIKEMKKLEEPEAELKVFTHWQLEMVKDRIPEEESGRLTPQDAKEKEVRENWKIENNATEDEREKMWEATQDVVDYINGIKGIVNASKTIAVWKIIEGKDLEDLQREQEVYEEWVPKLIEYGLTEEEARECVGMSIQTTKNVQDRVGVPKKAPLGGTRAEYMQYALDYGLIEPQKEEGNDIFSQDENKGHRKITKRRIA